MSREPVTFDVYVVRDGERIDTITYQVPKNLTGECKQVNPRKRAYHSPGTYWLENQDGEQIQHSFVARPGDRVEVPLAGPVITGPY